MSVSDSKKGYSETYRVKFWYEGKDGFWAQKEIYLYTNSKSSHMEVETYFNREVKPSYKNGRLVSVIYV